MVYCTNCGVELDEGMARCPLCGQAVAGPTGASQPKAPSKTVEVSPPLVFKKLSSRQKTVVWEIISIVLLSAIIVTLLVNFILDKNITWAVYPVTICLATFSYISLFAFWSKRTFVQIGGGFIIASVFLLTFDGFTHGTDWITKVAIPILFVASVLAILFLKLVHLSKYKGINLIAYILMGAALLCMGIEALVSLYADNQISLWWSTIVALCALIVAIVLLFIHFRLEKGRSLEKTFHL